MTNLLLIMDFINNSEKKHLIRNILTNTKIKLTQEDSKISNFSLTKFVSKTLFKDEIDGFVTKFNVNANFSLTEILLSQLAKIQFDKPINQVSIFIHPLTPNEIVKALEKLTYKVVFFQIDQKTLDIDINSYQKINETNKADLIIHYSITGQTNTFNQIITQDNSIVKHIIIDLVSNSDKLKDTLLTNKVSSYITNIIPNPVKVVLDQLFDVQIDNNSCWIAICPVQTLLEIVKGSKLESKDYNLKIVNYLLQLSIGTEKKEIKTSISDFIFQKRVEIDKIENVEVTKSELSDLLHEKNKINLSNFWFELIEICDFKFGKHQELHNEKSNELTELINNINKTQIDSSLFIPNLDFESVFFFYSDDINWWYNELISYGYNFYQLPSSIKQGLSQIDTNYSRIQRTCLITDI
jgi:hypothetical protein